MPLVAVLEDEYCTPELRLDALLPAEAGFRYERMSYSAAPERLCQSKAQLLLVLPAKELTRAAALFQ
ncbi:MAG: hypothetical protein ACRD3O_12035, partial [Terriglobia bacterium]